MKQFKYNVGDHVVIEESNVEWITKYVGKTGVVVECRDWHNGKNYDYKVHPDEWGKEDMDMDMGVWCKVKCLVPHTEKIVITTDGKTTTATLYENDTKVKSASAKCSPDDKFDFALGAAIAMDRLYPEKSEPKEEPAPKYLDCKFVLTGLTGTMNHYFTEGKVYTMTDGRVENDNGYRWPFHDPIKDEEDLKAYFRNTRTGENAAPHSIAKVIVIKEDC